MFNDFLIDNKIKFQMTYQNDPIFSSIHKNKYYSYTK